MASLRRISYLWKEPDAAGSYSTGISLHSHTNQSKETLDFLANLGSQYPLLRPILARNERRSREQHSIPINYSAAWWTPPLTPRIAFDVESGQIEKKLNLMPLVSITDHDTIAGGVERALRWRSGLPPRHPQPAQRLRLRLDEDLRRVHCEAEREAPD